MQASEALQVGQLLLTAGAIGGTIFGWMKSVKSLGAKEQKYADEIKSMKESVNELRHVIGNGGYSGLRQEIADMKLNCVQRMATIETSFKDHEKNQEKNGS